MRGMGRRWKWSGVALSWNGGKGGGLSNERVNNGLGGVFGMELLTRKN
jgi:hypothetical protein